MRIGIDCRTILNPGVGERAGVGHYTYYLVRHLLLHDKENHYVLFFDSRMKNLAEFRGKNVTVTSFPFSQYRKFLPFAYSHMLIAAQLLRHRLDVYHSPANVVPLTYLKPSVITVHDLAIYRNPAWFPTQVFSTRLLVPQSVKRAKRIIAVSQSTRKDLRDLFNTPTRKIRVIPEGVDVRLLPLKDRTVDVRKKYKLPQRFLLFVGTLEPRKNVPLLVRAFARIARQSRYADAGLVLAGAWGHKGSEVFEEIAEQKLKDRVWYVGYLPHNEKLNAIRTATGFVFPSLYEGFGLPVLEAMALGTPVVTSRVSSLPEVAGTAALLVDPDDEGEIARAMGRLLDSSALRHRLTVAGRAQAARFSWAATARETLAVYREVAAESARTKPRPQRSRRKG
jgi:glycosyltransferase involved in cell wall biosynthesis